MPTAFRRGKLTSPVDDERKRFRFTTGSDAHRWVPPIRRGGRCQSAAIRLCQIGQTAEGVVPVNRSTHR
jgi:hypothetical protein